MQYKMFYYPNLVIMPVDNNEHQRIDDVSTDRISYDIRSVETMGFALWRMDCSIVVYKRHNDRLSQWSHAVVNNLTCHCFSFCKMTLYLVNIINSYIGIIKHLYSQ